MELSFATVRRVAQFSIDEAGQVSGGMECEIVRGGRFYPFADKLVLVVPVSSDQAWAIVAKRMGELARWAKEWERPKVEVRYLVLDAGGRLTVSEQGYCVPAFLADKESGVHGSEQPIRYGDFGNSEISEMSQVSSYGAERVRYGASSEEVEDFIAGRQADGLIVTVMEMGSDLFLFVNGAQVRDRGGKLSTWVGTDAKQWVWRGSFLGNLPGRHRGVNYYRTLYEQLETGRMIRGYEYCVTRPSGAVYLDRSDYFLVENYLGCTVRIAVSRPGESQLLMSA
jgi:hypothetical protein